VRFGRCSLYVTPNTEHSGAIFEYAGEPYTRINCVDREFSWGQKLRSNGCYLEIPRYGVKRWTSLQFRSEDRLEMPAAGTTQWVSGRLWK